MELETLKQDIFRWAGWISIVLGLLVLAVFNISLLSGYDLLIAGDLSAVVILGFLLGIFAAVPKHSRQLGLWGMMLSLYIGFFTVVIFFLGWTIAPFP